LYSGGEDNKFISYSFQENKILSEYYFDGPVISILENQASAALLLVTLKQKENQILLLDKRSPSAQVYLLHISILIVYILHISIRV
jgi:hypothetical protein